MYFMRSPHYYLGLFLSAVKDGDYRRVISFPRGIIFGIFRVKISEISLT